jgi:putative hydrolase of the HAD superfamily
MSIEYLNKILLSTPPHAIIFDTDNTLYPYDPAHEKASKATIIKAGKLLGVTAEEFQGALNQARNQVKLRLGKSASSHSRLLYFQRAIEILGLRTQLLATLDLEQTYWRTFLSASELFDGVTDFVQDLRSAGIKTAIVTDLTAQIQFRKLIYFGLDKYFDYVVTSEEAGADKPHSAPFEIALEKLSVNRNQCWMIGDSADSDIGGAKRHGIFTLQKRHNGVVVERTGANAPDVIFDNFDELRGLLLDCGWIKRDFEEHNF